MSEKSIIDILLNSQEPAIRLKTYLLLLDHEYDSSEVKKILVSLKTDSPIISNLFAYLPKDNTSKTFHVYKKWQGAHWILSLLADIGYPPGDNDLIPSIDREMKWLLGKKLKLVINGKTRFCASQEGNGLYSALALGFFDERCKHIANRLIDHQWEDGGWNCDRKPEAHNSSYHESLIPLRALYYYSKEEKNPQLLKAIDKATELFLKRRLYKRLSNREIINKKWLLLHYPPYWHYDILFALKVLSEMNIIHDKRCVDALDLLESKRIENGGFPREEKYCQSLNPEGRMFTPGDWKITSKTKMNEWITIDTLYILKKAKRIEIEY